MVSTFLENSIYAAIGSGVGALPDFNCERITEQTTMAPPARIGSVSGSFWNIIPKMHPNTDSVESIMEVLVELTYLMPKFISVIAPRVAIIPSQAMERHVPRERCEGMVSVAKATLPENIEAKMNCMQVRGMSSDFSEKIATATM